MMNLGMPARRQRMIKRSNSGRPKIRSSAREGKLIRAASITRHHGVIQLTPLKTRLASRRPDCSKSKRFSKIS
jgi:hypothetical protein